MTEPESAGKRIARLIFTVPLDYRPKLTDCRYAAFLDEKQAAALIDAELDAERPPCPKCEGDRVYESVPAGAGHEDDLAEYLPCDECGGTGRLSVEAERQAVDYEKLAWELWHKIPHDSPDKWQAECAARLRKLRG